ncbi:MAG: alanyl-tRNA editing protein, partial [Clostridia bacterium]|nr:alanyl-tRNA editing protein [Clostridia bacterium]
MVTEKLYFVDSYVKEFEATVVSCQSVGDKCAVVLDKTAFFPEGGGQKADTGYIGDATVLDVQEVAGEILHFVKAPLDEGKVYRCKIDWDTRFLRMQEHTGEHIVSGIVHSMFGYDNVGFHMEDTYVTVDFSGELTREQLDEVEDKANFAVYANYPVKCYFPDESTLSDLDYRSKLDLTEGVRLVDIENTDLCACCAPHVNRTGEVGVIKILDFMRHRGGVRIFMKSGFDALRDYREKYKSVYDVSGLLSAKQGEIASAVERVLGDNDSIRREFNSFKQTVAENTKNNVIFTEKCGYCMVDGFDADMMRCLANY